MSLLRDDRSQCRTVVDSLPAPVALFEWDDDDGKHNSLRDQNMELLSLASPLVLFQQLWLCGCVCVCGEVVEKHWLLSPRTASRRVQAKFTCCHGSCSCRVCLTSRWWAVMWFVFSVDHLHSVAYSWSFIAWGTEITYRTNPSYRNTASGAARDNFSSWV